MTAIDSINGKISEHFSEKEHNKKIAARLAKHVMLDINQNEKTTFNVCGVDIGKSTSEYPFEDMDVVATYYYFDTIEEYEKWRESGVSCTTCSASVDVLENKDIMFVDTQVVGGKANEEEITNGIESALEYRKYHKGSVVYSKHGMPSRYILPATVITGECCDLFARTGVSLMLATSNVYSIEYNCANIDSIIGVCAGSFGEVDSIVKKCVPYRILENAVPVLEQIEKGDNVCQRISDEFKKLGVTIDERFIEQNIKGLVDRVSYLLSFAVVNRKTSIANGSSIVKDAESFKIK